MTSFKNHHHQPPHREQINLTGLASVNHTLSPVHIVPMGSTSFKYYLFIILWSIIEMGSDTVKRRIIDFCCRADKNKNLLSYCSWLLLKSISVMFNQKMYLYSVKDSKSVNFSFSKKFIDYFGTHTQPDSHAWLIITVWICSIFIGSFSGFLSCLLLRLFPYSLFLLWLTLTVIILWIEVTGVRKSGWQATPISCLCSTSSQWKRHGFSNPNLHWPI